MDPFSSSPDLPRDHFVKPDERGLPNSSVNRELSSELEEVLTHDICLALKGLQFGEVTITVRDGRVVQIERIARKRQNLPKRRQ